jgi:hypothetical protein
VSSPGLYLGLSLSVLIIFLQMTAVKKILLPSFLKKQKNNLEELSQVYYQKDRDSWNKVKQFVQLNLDHHESRLSLRDLKRELNSIHLAYKNSRTTVRMKLDELESVNFSVSKNS